MKRFLLKDVKTLMLEEVERPACPADGFVMKVAACAVCATDVKIYNYGHQLLKLPRVLGHELAGTIEEVGPAMRGRFTPGQRVAVCAVVNCGECVYCQRGIPSMCQNLEAFGYHYDGGYQEYMAVPNKAVRCGGVNVLADSQSFEEASIAELAACCINGQRLSRMHLGQSMLIIGSGPVGMLHAQIACLQGATAVYLADINPKKLDDARRVCGKALTGTLMSNDNDVLAAEVKRLTGGYGFDQVMICCSAPAAQQVALECVAKCGCINFFGGLPKGHSQVVLDTNHIHYKQCAVVGTHGSSAEDNRVALDLIARGSIDVKSLITETIGLEKLEDALQLNEANNNRLKTVVVYGD